MGAALGVLEHGEDTEQRDTHAQVQLRMPGRSVCVTAGNIAHRWDFGVG